MWRASESISPSVSSATLVLAAPGAFITTMPRVLAASRSMLSTPAPARAIARSFGEPAISAAVTLVAERTISASASAIAGSSSAGVRPVAASTLQPSSRSS